MYRLNTDIFYYDEADNIGVAINFTNGFCYTMNRIGTAIVRELIHGADPEKVKGFFTELEGCPPDFEKMAVEFIDKLRDHSMIVWEDTGEENQISLTSAEVSEGFVPGFEEFRDAQDLILADPVHDVDADFGWPGMN